MELDAAGHFVDCSPSPKPEDKITNAEDPLTDLWIDIRQANTVEETLSGEGRLANPLEDRYPCIAGIVENLTVSLGVDVVVPVS